MDKKVSTILMGIVVIFIFIIAIKEFFILREQVYFEAYYNFKQ